MDMNKLGEGVNRFGFSGSSVIVERAVGVKIRKGVKVGRDVLATAGPAASGVVVGGSVLSTNKSGVKVGSREKGVAVG